MFRILFILFITVPVIEIYLLIQVGSLIGALPTIGVVIGTAILGAFLLKQQGLSTLQRVQIQLSKGQIPAIEMLEGLILLICGALLLTPGFFTDTIGFLCLVPVLRRGLARWLLKHINIVGPPGGFGGGPQSGQTRHADYIEGDFRRDD